MIYLYLIVILVVLFILYVLYENKNPNLTYYKIYKKLPRDIKLLKIVHISDLHNCKFGKNQNKIVSLVNNNADFIFITGDIIDRKYTNIDVALELIDNLSGNILFIKGNHEKGAFDYYLLEEELKKRSVKILNDEKLEFSDYEIIGLEDPSEYINPDIRLKKNTEYEETNESLKKLVSKDKFTLLLSHRPEYFDLYVKYNIDVVFSGHAHGGQVRIFNKPLIASGQGLFPKYAGGIYRKNNTIMINSRGLGNNFWWAKRIFNRPHVIEVDIINENLS